MHESDCQECNRLHSHYEQTMLDHNAAGAEFEAASRGADLARAARARDRLQQTEKERVEARQEVLRHEKVAHPARVSSAGRHDG